MTYAEAIKNSLDKIPSLGIYPVCFAGLTRGLTGLMMHLSGSLLMQDFPDATIDGEKYSGKAEESVNYLRTMQLIMGVDSFTPRGMTFSLKWGEFLRWLLDQPILDTDENMWYDPDVLIDKFNEFAINSNKTQ